MTSSFKKYSALLSICLVLFLVATPVFAQESISELVPCGNPGQKECNFYDILILLNRLVNWAIIISFFVATGVFAYAGFLLMTTGVVDKKTKAKSMIVKVFIGYFFIVAAWFIVDVVLDALLSDKFPRNSILLQKN